MPKIIFSNVINHEVSWKNSSEETVAIMVINAKGRPIKASKMMPNQEILVPPNGHIELI